MSDRVRVQLQQGHTDIGSVVPGGISADLAVAALARLHADNKTHQSDAAWQKALADAIKRATDWVKRVKQGGGYVPLRGSGTAFSVKFPYDRKEYRIDIEVHGSKDAPWFQ